jgi:cation transport protein ChaC
MAIKLQAPLDIGRDRLLAGDVLEAARETAGMAPISTAEEIRRDVEALIEARPARGDVWFFAYGSLMWNPGIRFSERRGATIYGWSRRFCLWTPLSRGTPERPGLILGLDCGGACCGIAYRIAEADLLEEFVVLWHREMADRSYIPRWVRGRFGASNENGWCLTFTMDRTHPRYAGRMLPGAAAEVIAAAQGRMGANSDYLFRTAASLRSDRLRDRPLEDLAARVLSLTDIGR